MDRLSAMDLRQLEYFVAVCETSSFTHAASRVHVVQSGLSASIRALERELGTALFTRTTRRVRLTDAGETLLADARRILASVDQARDSVAAVTGGISGTVRFGIMHSLVATGTAAALAAFHHERPRVRLLPRTNPAGSAGLVRAVRDSELDFAIAAVSPDQAGDVELVSLRSEPLMLACPPGHRLARRKQVRLAELTEEPFVDVPPGWGSRASTDRLFTSIGLSRRIDIEVGDVATVVELVRAGLGVALIAPSSAPPPADLPMLRPRPAPCFEVSLVLPTTRRLGPAARALANAILEGAGRRTITDPDSA
jgi:DNA-binding transcriptional LysR family regulator